MSSPDVKLIDEKKLEDRRVSEGRGEEEGNVNLEEIGVEPNGTAIPADSEPLKVFEEIEDPITKEELEASEEINLTPGLRLPLSRIKKVCTWFNSHCIALESIVDEGDQIDIAPFIGSELIEQFYREATFPIREYYYPTYHEIMQEVERMGLGLSKQLNKMQFIQLIDNWVIEPVAKDQLKLAFKVFDTENRGYLDMEEIKIVMERSGDALNEAELGEMMRDLNYRGDGIVYYDEFVDNMFSVVPELANIKVDWLYENYKMEPGYVEPLPTPPPTPPPEPEPEPEPPKRKKGAQGKKKK